MSPRLAVVAGLLSGILVAVLVIGGLYALAPETAGAPPTAMPSPTASSAPSARAVCVRVRLGP